MNKSATESKIKNFIKNITIAANTKAFTQAYLAAFLISWLAWNTYSNLVFSASFEEMQFRGIDDTAFQIVMRQIHEAIVTGNFGDVFSRNDYAYGWVFWAINSLITLPFYLIGESGSSPELGEFSEWMIVFLPRELSLLLVASSIGLWLLTFSKIVKNSTWVLWIATPMMLFMPVITYAATKFHPTSMTMFFLALAAYLASRWLTDSGNSKSIGLKMSVAFLFVGLAVATKVNSLPASLGIMILVLALSHLKLGSKWFPTCTLAFITAGFFSILLASPLAIYQLLGGEVPSLVSIINSQFSKVSSDSVSIERIAQNVIGFDSYILWLPILLTLLFGVIRAMAYSQEKKEDQKSVLFLSILIGNLLSLVFFPLTVSMGSMYSATYAATIIPSITFGIYGLFFVRIKHIVSIALLAALLITGYARNLSQPTDDIYSPLMKLDYFQRIQESNEHYQRSKSLDSLRGAWSNAFPNAPSQLRIISDYRAPLPWTPLDSSVSIIYTFGDFASYRNSFLNHEFDLAVIWKGSFRSKTLDQGVPEVETQNDLDLIRFDDSGLINYEILYEDDLITALVSKKD